MSARTPTRGCLVTIEGIDGAGKSTQVERLASLLMERGYRRVRLWTLSGANRARRFYARAGFEETGHTRERDFGDGRPVLEVEYLRPATR